METNVRKSVWLFDPVHTKIRFETKYLLLTTVSGWFGEFEGSVTSRTEDFSDSQVRLTLYTHSLCTGNEERDAHLRSPDFFDARRYPTITFTSTSVKAVDTGVVVTGQLRIKDITETISFDATFTGSCLDDRGNRKAGFEMTLHLNRKDFHISWNRFFDKAGILLSDDVTIHGDVQLLQVS
ncbi:YceI family protein [Paraflavisolibacter sp. H34]|uniref:YceI family protein n=1 Tax=Huijunlia imazamoxiresistens TaxID=3127457 RepID=UPI0030174B6D